MIHLVITFAAVALLFTLVTSPVTAEPIRLHPDNPHYFLFRGEPTLLITSGEHYGAVLNLDFDYEVYLETLATDGLNNTRMFVGAYCEPPGAFKITRNTLAPAEGRFICPWARSDTPGYANGGNKFDLTEWDAAYFERLSGFLAKADECGVVVEVNLFCPFYREEMWELSPMNARNNVNGLGEVERDRVYAVPGSDGLLALQEELTRKVVTELKGFDNLYYEIMNEPYACKVPLAWEHHIAEVIVETEKQLGVKHLISRNVNNGKEKVLDPHPAISILNFHYAHPPETVAMNYHLNRPIGDNETGFKGTGIDHYRHEAWEFILAGGALYNNLDYSFTVGHEGGTFEYPKTQPGSGGVELRKQLRYLKEFIASFDFVRLAPGDGVVTSLPDQIIARVLSEAGKQYAAYLRRVEATPQASPAEIALSLPAGTYQVAWLDVQTGERSVDDVFTHAGGNASLRSPPFADGVALRIVAKD